MTLEAGVNAVNTPIDTCFIPKAISLLSAESPFFDAFWPLIFDGADIQTQQSLELTSTYFRRLAKCEQARRLSEQIKANHRYFVNLNSVREMPPNPLRLDPLSETPLWYQFSAKNVFFQSVANFEAFCRLTGVDPTEGVNWHRYTSNPSPSVSFLSSTGDIHMRCFEDPMDNDQFWTRYLGCIGEREKVLRLESWFRENCVYYGFSLGGNNYM